MRMTGIGAAVVDIEGTAGSASYVHDVMFPFARMRYRDWFDGLPTARRDRILAQVRAEALNPELSDAVAAFTDWTERDVKSPTLKAVQSQIWHAAFEAGELRGDVYTDVPPAFEEWHDRGIRTYIYSSGAIRAQQDWFRHSNRGDLTVHLDGYFDLQTAGRKTDPASYRTIAGEIGLAAESIVFFSDTPAELDAATRCEMRAVLVDRARGCSSEDHNIIDNFGQVELVPLAVQRKA